MADIHNTLIRFDLLHGQPVRVSPLVQRLTANNPSVYTGPGTNTYLVGKERFAVVDPGPADAAHIDAILEATQGRIDTIFATHCHEDHSPAAAPLAQETGAEVVGFAVGQDESYLDQSFSPSQQLVDGGLYCGDGWTMEAILTPGHLGSHACFLLKEEQMLFAGDQVMQGASVVILSEHGGAMWDYLDSLKKLQGRGIQLLAPGHGHLLSNVDQVLQELYDHRMNRENLVLKGLSVLPRATVEELIPLVYEELAGLMQTPQLKELIPVLKKSILSHLHKLLREGKVLSTGQDQIWQLAN